MDDDDDDDNDNHMPITNATVAARQYGLAKFGQFHPQQVALQKRRQFNFGRKKL